MIIRGTRANITPDNEATIIDASLANRGMSRSKLARKLQKDIDWKGPAPKIEVLERKISKYRNRAQPGPLDEPWSLGMLKEYDVAQNAVDSLIEVWKFSIAVGHIITVREALWAARLAKGFKDKHISHLLHYSLLYSSREIVSELLGNKTIDTRDLDAEWGLDNTEHHLQILLGTVPKRIFHSDIATLRQKDVKITPLHRWQIFFYTRAVPQVLLDTTTGKEHLVSLGDILPTSNYLDDLTNEQDRIFAAVLLLLSKGPKWKTLSKDNYQTIISEVKQYVIRGDIQKNSSFNRDIRQTINPELLRMVGYEVTAKEGGKP